MRLNICVLFFAHWLSFAASANPTCGGILTAKKGIISTPNFPGPFATPIHCQWLISRNEDDTEASIVVYLTQVFITSGLKFTEYLYYDEAYKAGARVIHTVSESSATHVKWLQVSGPFLLIELTLNRLEGHHLRALPRLLDVYGFNITYEISTTPVKPYQCNTIECRFLGNCYANSNYTEYSCACFSGYSGKDCGDGPLCARHGRPTCHNGGTCRQIGAAAVSCICPQGFVGDLCEVPENSEPVGCEDGSCALECPYDGKNACNCNANNSIIVTPERVRYETVIKLADKPKVTIDLINQMTSYLRSLNLSKNIEISNISSDGEVTIQAWGDENFGTTLQTSLSRISKLANLRLSPGIPRFHSEPALFLQTVAVNQRQIIWEGAEFILSCVAQGSPHMNFNWYKDGVRVNVSRATRNTWMRIVDLEGSGESRWSALLGVARAAALDSGVFRCQVASSGRQQCKSIRLHVLAPEVRLAPMSVTAQKGDNVTLTCLSTNSGGLHGKLGYSWTRNKALFPLTPGVEVWEDLAPAGSILHLYNIQKSAEYSCHVSSAVSARVRSVYVRVLSYGSNVSRGLCPSGSAWGVRWPSAAPADHLLECPIGYSGYVTRICEMRNAPFESEWNIPDFSKCVADGITDIYEEFEKITYGYGNMTAVQIIKQYLEWILKKSLLFPGEAGHLLHLTREALDYIRFLNIQTQKDEAIEPYFKIINMLLKSEHGVLDQAGFQELQQAVLLGGVLGGGISLHLSEITIYCNGYTKPYSTYRVKYPFQNISLERWDKESSTFHLSQIDGVLNVPEKLFLTFVIYKNLTKYFSPIYYSTEIKEGNGLEFWVASHIVIVRITSSESVPLLIQSDKFSFILQLHKSIPTTRSKIEGSIICGKYESGTWSKACETQQVTSEITQCFCNDQGIYALLLAKQLSKSNESDSTYGKELIAGAFSGGAFSVLLSGLLLLPAWLRRRCCLMYLKLHYCFVTSLALGLMLYCLTTDLCGNMAGGWLELLLLGGGAALVAQLLLLHAELAWPAPPPPHLPRTILMLMTGVCVLAALCSRAAGDDDWGLRFHSTPMNVFAAASALLAVLHFLLCICVMARLRLLATKLPDRNNYIQKRMGLMRRSAVIFICSKILEVASIIHYNMPSNTSTNALAVTAILLGTMVFGCYIIRDETAIGIKRLFHPKEADWDCSSDYINTSLSFFIKQGCEVESRCANPNIDNPIQLAQQPSSHWLAPSSHHTTEHRERSMGKQADIVKSVEFKNIPPNIDSPERTMVGTVVGPVSSVCDLVPPCASVLPQIDPPTPHPQEYVTRVCVELGILSRSNQPPPGPIASNEPPIVLCSVDFEPYSDQKYDITNLDTADNCVLCIGKSKQDVSDLSQTPIKSCLKNKDVHPIYCKDILKDSSTNEPESGTNTELDSSNVQFQNKINDTSKSTADPNIDGMLDLISHDLDYLLNRNPPNAPLIAGNLKHAHCHTSGEASTLPLLEKIQEESL